MPEKIIARQRSSLAHCTFCDTPHVSSQSSVPAVKSFGCASSQPITGRHAACDESYLPQLTRISLLPSIFVASSAISGMQCTQAVVLNRHNRQRSITSVITHVHGLSSITIVETEDKAIGVAAIDIDHAPHRCKLRPTMLPPSCKGHGANLHLKLKFYVCCCLC